MKFFISAFVDSLPRLAAVVALAAISWFFVADFLYQVAHEQLRIEHNEASEAIRNQAAN